MKKIILLSAILFSTAGLCDDLSQTRRQLELINPTAVELALKQMHSQWPGKCPDPQSFLWLKTLRTERDQLLKKLSAKDASAIPQAEELRRKVRNALTALPLLPECEMLAVERGVNNLMLPSNWGNLHETKRKGLTNRIVRIRNLKDKPEIVPLWKPSIKETFAGHLDLHWNADRLMFTSNNENGNYRVYEMQVSQSAEQPKLMQQIEEPDVDNYTGCWLADDDHLFLSTATMIGVPCVRGGSYIANLYKYSNADKSIRRLTFDQEHNWFPRMMSDGSVMYLRWEYSDIPHFVARILFTMNPDGTTQRELYGSNSYWPNSMFHARPVPGHPHKFAAVVSGHHDTRREGELVIFDPSRGRHEASGVVQRIPGRGKKVDPKILDRLVSDSWPKFLFPWPLDENFYLVSCKPDKAANYGIYLVDTFDNLTLLCEVPGKALLEITPLQQRKRPPVRPSLIEQGKPARVKIIDIYQGPGLAGVPRGTVKELRIISYAFSYRGMGGQVDRVGLDGPWDVKRILGTVPVSPDGSAFFEVPPNTPVAFQPLDEKGRALQLMRSWTTVMPGELQSCTGCHEPQNMGSGPRVQMKAMNKPPAKIKAWHGPTRGFSFNREVQPVLDRACIRCHDGKNKCRPDFTCRPPEATGSQSKHYNDNALFPPAYTALRRFVRGHTIESDGHLLDPCEYHTSTTELVRMLEVGHHGVKLNSQEWDRINTWIDLNTPAHGTWTEIAGEKRTGQMAQRRRELMKRYAGVDEDLEDTEIRKSAVKAACRPGALTGRTPPGKGTRPTVKCSKTDKNSRPDAPARRTICKPEPYKQEFKVIELDNDTKITFVKIPGGTITLPDGKSTPVNSTLWAMTTEISNAQYANFDPSHDSRIESGDFLQFSVAERGFPCNLPNQPVSHVSQNDAEKFCEWLSKKSGVQCRLPSIPEWQWIARAGNNEEYPWLNKEKEFAKSANLADKSFNKVEELGWGLPIGAIFNWRPANVEVDDGHRVCSPVGTLTPNAWGLHDTTGNVWEWTSWSSKNGLAQACGGSWCTRPKKAGYSATVTYPEWQKVYDVGFRVVMKE